MTPFFPALEIDDYIPVPRTFRAKREAEHTPTRAELLAADLLLDDDDEALETPAAMTDNDAFRIIEIIKEREAAKSTA